jgi:hypothetical protein
MNEAGRETKIIMTSSVYQFVLLLPVDLSKPATLGS